MSAGCGAESGFSIVSAASAYSGLAGVLAGVLFTGIVLLVGLPTPPDPQRNQARKSALEMMTPALLVALVASLLFGEVGGEDVCRRGEIEACAAGALLGVAAVATFQAIGWMLASVETSSTQFPAIAAVVGWSVGLVGVCLLAITADDASQEYRRVGAKTTALIWVFAAVGLGLVVTIAVMWWFRVGPVFSVPWVSTAALIGPMIIGIGVFVVVGLSLPSQWTGPTPRPVVASSIGALFIAYLLALGAHLLAAPRRP